MQQRGDAAKQNESKHMKRSLNYELEKNLHFRCDFRFAVPFVPPCFDGRRCRKPAA